MNAPGQPEPPADRDAPVAATPPQPSPPARFPLSLLLGYLLLQLLLLTWSAYPAATMKADQPMESWLFLAGLQAAVVSWLWPMLRLRGAVPRQAALEALLLAAGSLGPAVAAVGWVDASAWQVAAPSLYLLGWLLASGIALAAGCRHLRAVWATLMTLANFGLLAVGYFTEDFLNRSAEPLWRWCPMVEAARLTELGSAVSDSSAEMLAAAVPAGLALALLAGAVVRQLVSSRPGSAGPSASA